MNTVFWLIVIAVIIHGLIAGISFDVAAVKLPTRKRTAPLPMPSSREATTWATAS